MTGQAPGDDAREVEGITGSAATEADPLGAASPPPPGLAPYALPEPAQPATVAVAVAPSAAGDAHLSPVPPVAPVQPWHLQGSPRLPAPPPPSAQWNWPAPPWQQPWGPPPPPAPRPLGRVPLVAGALALLLVSGGTGAAIARLTAHTPVSPTTQASTSPGIASSSGSGSANGSGSGSGSGSTGTSGNPAVSGAATSGGAASIADVPAVVDPAIVDITNTLADGSGVAAGTGMVITGNGEVLTNNHVIAGAGTITVLIGGVGKPYPATVMGDDPVSDVALLQVQGVSGLTTITTGDPGQLQIAQPVVALGNALGKEGTPAVAQGQITALNQSITASDDTGATEQLTGLIEHDAKIQPGDSGGPLADSTGRVIGMNTAATVGSSRFRINTSSAAYAIPISTAMTVVKQIETGDFSGTVQRGTRPIIGVRVSSTQGAVSGASVAGVQSGSPAEAAGLAAGDTIVAVDGTAVANTTELGAAIQKHQVGDTISVDWVDSGGARHSASIKLAAGPPA